jgi:hypothetical protein
MYTVRAITKYQNQSVKYDHRVSCLPALGAVLGRPAPLRLVTMSIAGRLGLATSGLHVTARHVAAGRLWTGAVATASSSGEWWVRAMVAASASRVRWVRTVVVTIASGEWRVRSMAVTGRRVSSSVGDNYSRSLAITKSDGGSLSGAGARVGAMTRAGTRARVGAMARAGARARARA